MQLKLWSDSGKKKEILKKHLQRSRKMLRYVRKQWPKDTL